MGERRFYRDGMGEGRFVSFRVTRGETDLWIGVDPASWRPELPAETVRFVERARGDLVDYIVGRPEFRISYEPLSDDPAAPPIARAMLDAARAAGVGPMAAVAGALSDAVAEFLSDAVSVREAVVENGGDIRLAVAAPCLVSIHAGRSPLSDLIAVEAGGPGLPAGIATSAGRLGHSFSYGRADACVAAAGSAALADAYATACGNRLGSAADLRRELEAAKTRPGLRGLAAIVGGSFGCAGDIRIAALAANSRRTA